MHPGLRIPARIVLPFRAPFLCGGRGGLMSLGANSRYALPLRTVQLPKGAFALQPLLPATTSDCRARVCARAVGGYRHRLPQRRHTRIDRLRLFWRRCSPRVVAGWWPKPANGRPRIGARVVGRLREFGARRGRAPGLAGAVRDTAVGFSRSLEDGFGGGACAVCGGSYGSCSGRVDWRVAGRCAPLLRA